MKLTSQFAITFLAIILSAGLLTAADASASEKETTAQATVHKEKPGEMYLPSDDAMADLAMTLDHARVSDRLALVVMGANWCHDSRALAERLQQQPLMSIIEESYETVFIDVGYLEKGEKVITSLGVPVYYATPTVLIVDPVSGKLVNADNRHLWANADSVSMEDSLAYFQSMADVDLNTLRTESEASEQLQALLDAIDAFEEVQAERLYRAYAVLSPMLKAYKTENRKFSAKDWNIVREFRYKVPADMDALRAEATRRLAAHEENITLHYPEYPPFPWETEQAQP